MLLVEWTRLEEQLLARGESNPLPARPVADAIFRAAIKLAFKTLGGYAPQTPLRIQHGRNQNPEIRIQEYPLRCASGDQSRGNLNETPKLKLKSTGTHP